MAAVLAGGVGAALSHWSAARLWGLTDRRSTKIHISVPRSRRWEAEGLEIHRPRKLDDDIESVQGIAITSVARTLIDLAARSSAQDLRRLLHEAEVLRLTDRVAVLARLEQSPSARGAKKLRLVLATNSAPSKREFERRFNQLVVDAGLPAPRKNAIVKVRG